MKKTQFIDLVSTIRKTAVSFIVITVFITLGLAFYGGASWCVEHTEDSFVQTYRDGKMRTLWVTDPLGLTDEQVEALKAQDGVDDAEGFNIVYRFLENKEGARQQAAVVQITERIDLLMHVEGRLPQAAGEAAVLRSWAEEYNVAIGDVISLQDEDGTDYRELRSVRNVAQWNGENPEDLAFGTDDPGYLAETSLTVTAIVDSPVYLSTNPHAHGLCPANGLYIDTVFFVSKEEMPPEAFGGYTSVAIYNEELNSISGFSDEYRARSQALSESVQSVLDGWDRQLVGDFGKSVDTLRAQQEALRAYTGAAAADGEALYEQLDSMRQELEGRARFSGVTETEANASFLTADNLIGVLGSLRTVMGITFLAIGVLISYSVISRLVADGAVQIGTRKALGFYRREILRFYVCYAGAAILLGGILGLVIGVFGIENVLVKVFSSQFTFSSIPLIFNLSDVLPVFLILCGIIIAVTVTACIGETGKNAIDLLRGTHKETGDYGFVQRSRLFKKLSLLNQTVLLNLFRDKRRVFGMITGVAGAAALMTAGMTFYLNFTNAFEKQFREYYLFDYQVCYDKDAQNASAEIRRILDSHGLEYAEIYNTCMVLYTPDGKTNAPSVTVPTDTEELAKVMRFDSDPQKTGSFDGGVWMSEYYRYAFDSPVGSLLDLCTLEGSEVTVPVDCYYKQHLSTPEIIMDKDTYRSVFGEEAVPNAFYVASAGADMQQLNAEMEAVDGYVYSINIYEANLASFSTEKLVVVSFAALFILMAVLMALMTIINLLNVYISEKKNELIILMINGYDRRFAKSYIYQDTIVLTLIGIAIGLVAGNFLGDRALFAVEGTALRVIHGVSWLSCGVAAVATAALTALICSRTLRRVDRFRLSDISAGS